jgi:hypothetical protein
MLAGARPRPLTSSFVQSQDVDSEDQSGHEEVGQAAPRNAVCRKIMCVNRRWIGLLLVTAAALVMAARVMTSGQNTYAAIDYATRPTTDRVAKLSESLATGGRQLQRDARTGYLGPVLDALGVPVASQLLVFSKTGVQRAHTGPHDPRAIFFDDSVAVGYLPGAPVIEIAAHDPQQGVIFYTVDQSSPAPVFIRQTSCLTCHQSESTLNVPGVIAHSNAVDVEGNVLAQLGGNDVDHRTPHPDRWGGWYVTSDGSATQYAQRAHAGNITFSGRGNTSNEVFIEWLNSSPESRGYISGSSDISALLVFDHQMHAINLLTKLNWESRVSPGTIAPLVDELADYLLFVGEVPPSVALLPSPGFAKALEARIPKDRQGRSFGQLDLVNRMMRYPCSYMIYAAAFDGLPAPAKGAVYRRMLEILSGNDTRPAYKQLSAADRRAVIEILRDTKPDFPAH